MIKSVTFAFRLKQATMPRKILIIRFSSIGDIVLTTPVVRGLSCQYKDAEIHFLTKRRFSAIVESNPYINKVYTIDTNVSEVMSQLRRESYHHIIDLHNNLRSYQVIIGLLRPFHRFRKLNFRKWLLVRFRLRVMPPVHIVDRYMKTVKKLGVVNDEQGLNFFIPENQ
ncbi:MAG: glycosyltransferase family 9 protein, partial [Lentimicrobium sp.]|nr:glycosyltransferase family 9 protein [Lentimicrobium sp.]